VFGALGVKPQTSADFDVKSVGQAGKLPSGDLISPITDFYLTNPIARASNVMAECSELVPDQPLTEAAE